MNLEYWKQFEHSGRIEDYLSLWQVTDRGAWKVGSGRENIGMQEYICVTGIILKQTPVGEYDRHISLLTKERGKISAFARGARKAGEPPGRGYKPFFLWNL